MSVLEQIRLLGMSFLNMIYPPVCLLCGEGLEAGGLVCKPCAGSFPAPESIACRRCGAPPADEPGGKHSCICRNLPAELELLRSAVRYESAVRDLIHHFKFGGYRGLNSIMAEAMLREGRSLVPEEEDMVVMGVPLHRARRRERGYDQAAILARDVSRGMDLVCLDGVLVRKKHSKPQSDLSLDERIRNLENAFVVRKASAVEGRTVLLVDDVVTTGITLGSCTRALVRAGARRTIALTFARRI